MSRDFPAARAVIMQGLTERAFPAAAVEVGATAGVAWREAFGRLRYETDAPACTVGTVFDLASLTKVIATASVAMALARTGTIALDEPVERRIPDWPHEDVTIEHLLDHSSGLPGHARLWPDHAGREAYARTIPSVPLAYAPGTRSVYSDLGFILLGLLLERAGGQPLDALLSRVLRPGAVGEAEVLTYQPGSDLRARIAPTERDPWRGRELIGEVHDENAAALGGVAAHAGLFGTVSAVGHFARLVLRTFREDTPLGTPDLMRRFASKSAVPGSSRALGWDTMLPTSSCGTLMSPTAIGHVGFTGTSLWIDWERDLYTVWLTNRVHPTRENTRIRSLRPRLHDAIIRELLTSDF